MISSKNIRFHAPSDTYIIPKNSLFEENVAINGNVIVGSGVRFWKSIKIDGNIQLGKGCTVEGNIKADNIIIGSRSKIKGNVSALGDVSVFQNAAVRSIESGGTILITEGCIIGYADGRKLEVIGRADIQKIGVITKVTVRADNVAAMEEDEEDLENTAEENLITAPETVNILKKESVAVEIVSDRAEDVEIMEKIDEKTDESIEVSGTKFSENNLSDENFSMPISEDKNKTDIRSDTTKNSSTTPPLRVEKTIENRSQPAVNSTVPEDEMSDVEILSAAESKEPARPSGAGRQKTIETPFGIVSIDDYAVETESVAESVSESVSIVPESILESVSEPVSRFKSKPWPQFDPFNSPSPSPFGADRKSSAVKGSSAQKISVSKVSDSPAVQKEEFGLFRYEEIRIEDKPQTKADVHRPISNDMQKANQKIIFEEIGDTAVLSLKTPRPNPTASVQMTAVQTAAAQTGAKSGNKFALIFEDESLSDKKQTFCDSCHESESGAFIDPENSKMWFEERFRPVKSKQKEYPPYI